MWSCGGVVEVGDFGGCGWGKQKTADEVRRRLGGAERGRRERGGDMTGKASKHLLCVVIAYRILMSHEIMSRLSAEVRQL